MILRRILAEILHGVDDLGAVLYLIEDDECLFRYNLLTAGQHQILQNPIYILGGFKELLIFLIFIKVKIGGIFIIASAKFFKNPGLAHLAHAF